mmetsp:Transcript_5224/g.10593  ORF Transcript_5224/g.10593 Transcript_5224/m.10593 type:complete len:86 (-) Transcript_5224:123-380(-)|eukprot:CAMPEP_0113307140 /NCGR_PEP_ID=MMETSP0010_2-20120614/6109_1 /TAXON_ID=216773 ORGANISM="Corethron hystrix, Strain 308" /NCGR_SAMPLE_ID=MMETSP0010_2 /ASSEMBLY_ACC=CAM_ASM_000155 /LENGTH=85 /DNA_ID=CAMNT_0000161945 /DNA_START=552 /DNA_END=809 /DNA_ORIENTATION=- /assembly_acc=CAM_ASM_000155
MWNFVVARYLVCKQHMVDNVHNHRGNTTEDCTKQSQNYVLVWWLRRHISPYVRMTLRHLFPEAAAGRVPSRTVLRWMYDVHVENK